MKTGAPVIERLDYRTDAGLGQRARIGLIVLQTDQTIERDFARLMPPSGVALYHARLPSAPEVSPATLRQMARDLPATAALLPPVFAFDAIGYACTSGATVIGEARVAEMLRAVHPAAAVSDPITACKAALVALKVRRIALITPYTPDVTLAMQANLRAAGIAVAAVGSFGQSDEFTVARIAPQSVLDAVLRMGSRDDVEGVFVSCTGLRALDAIAAAEAALGKPVIASNQVLAWHLMRLAGLRDVPREGGRLFALQGAAIGSQRPAPGVPQ